MRILRLPLAACLLSSAAAAAGLAGGPEYLSLTAVLDPAAAGVAVIAEMTLPGAAEVTARVPSGAIVDGATVAGLDVPAGVGGDAVRLSVPGDPARRYDVRLAYRVDLSVAETRAHGSALLGVEGGFLPPAAWLAVFDPQPGRYRLTVEAPAGQIAVGTGRLLDERVTESGYRAVFEGRLAGEPPTLFVGPYEIAERWHGRIRLRTYFHPEVARLADDYLGQAGRYLDLYRRMIGSYPYAGFSMVTADLPVGLGFPGLAFFSRRIAPMTFMRTRSLAHEILHNWWGNGVRPDYPRGNWAEGLTTYMADHYLAEMDGAGAARDMRFRWLRDYAALPPARDVPVARFTAGAHAGDQVIGYGKVAMIFHMLRDRLGETPFGDAVRAFWRDHEGGVASWDDIRQSFADASGERLDEFFEQWVARAGAPRLSLAHAAGRRTDAGWRLDVSIAQAEPNFVLTVPVVVETEAGARTVDLRLDGPAARETLRLGRRPLAVSVDPGYRLFRRLAAGEAPPILRDVTLNPSSRLLIAGEDAELVRAALSLAAHMLAIEESQLDRARAFDEAETRPVLLIGLANGIDGVLAEHRLAPTPTSLAGLGTARVWAMRRPNGAPLVVVAADHMAALKSLERRLPHYGGQSFVAFDAGRAVETGLWPPTGEHALRRRLD